MPQQKDVHPHGQRSATNPSESHQNCVCLYTQKSLYCILRENPGKALFELPARWTDEQAEFLGTRWEKLPACVTPRRTVASGTAPSQGHLNPSKTISTLCDGLTEILQPDPELSVSSSNPKEVAVKKVFETLWPKAFDEPHGPCELHLYFGRHAYLKAVKVNVLWDLARGEEKSCCSSPTSASTQFAARSSISTQPLPKYNPPTRPAIAYIDKGELTSARNKVFRIGNGPNGSPNEPALGLQKIMSGKLLPSKTDHDAYLVGVFLGMAQTHFYPPPPDTNKRELRMRGIMPDPGFHDLKLRIITHDNKTSEFIVYTGYVTRQFLQKFHDPFTAPCDSGSAASSGIKIEYTKVPVWPVLGLRERLGKALGHEVVGIFDPNLMETWEGDPKKEPGKEEDGMKKADKKRKRKLFAQPPSSNGDNFDEKNKRQRGR
ncbi:hypothetical protein FGRA07_11414 [Fusarium graminearum]|uniref:Uncharacterized protein n=1 Tax=Gibberella zeae TaxID=5518 RepID=A0A2H3G8I0_GIBZA|nr:hypothetical protein FGRA07_11414 [Fusarium graminearum]